MIYYRDLISKLFQKKRGGQTGKCNKCLMCKHDWPPDLFPWNRTQGWCLTCVQRHQAAANTNHHSFNSDNLCGLNLLCDWGIAKLSWWFTPMMFGWWSSCRSLISRSAVLLMPTSPRSQSSHYVMWINSGFITINIITTHFCVKLPSLASVLWPTLICQTQVGIKNQS